MYKRQLEDLADALVLRAEVATKMDAPPPEVDGVVLATAVRAITRPRVEGAPERGTEVVFSPDGSRFAAARGAEVSLWDAAEGRLVATLRGRGQDDVEPRTLRFTPDGARLLAAFQNGTARSWGARDGTPDVALGEGPSVRGGGGLVAPAQSTVLSSDGALAQLGRVVRHTRDGRTVATLPEGTPDALDLRLLPGGERFLFIAGDGALRMWDARRGGFEASVGALTTRRRTLQAATFSPDGALVLAREPNGPLRAWSVRVGTFVDPPAVPADPTGAGLTPRAAVVEGAALSSRGLTLLVRPEGRSLHLWNDGDGALVWTPADRRTRVAAARFAADGRDLFTVAPDGAAVWRVGEVRARVTLRGEHGGIDRAALSPDGTRALVLHDDGTARLWRIADGAPLHALGRWRPDSLVDTDRAAPPATPRDEASFSADGSLLLTTGTTGDPTQAREDAPREARLWDAATGRLLRTLTAPEHGGVAAAWLSPDGARAFTGHADFTVRLWDARSGVVIADWPADDGETLALTFSRDGARFATAHALGRVNTWDARTGARAGTRELHPPSDRSDATLAARAGDRPTALMVYANLPRLTGAAFSADGARVFTSSADHIDRLWDATTGRHLRTLPYAAGASACASFTDDHARLATAYEDGTFALWDARDGRFLAAVPAHVGAVTGLAFSADGRRLVTASSDGAARVWSLDPAVITRAACALLRRRPLWEERRVLREACGERR